MIASLPFRNSTAAAMVILAAAACPSLGAMKPPTSEELAALPKLPEALPASVLAPERFPRLLSRADLERARHNVATYPWAKAYLEERKAVCDRFASMSEVELRALVPAPGSLFVMGLGMNLDPFTQTKMTWAGWSNPFSVKDSKGNLYPTPEMPDDGTGYVDPKTRQRYYFVAIANAAVVGQLEREILPALADVYALTGSKAHARAAAILLDALAAAYPGSIRGPLDYPMGKELRRYGGRLDRPTQQVARGIASYAQVIDLVAASGELEAPSHFEKGRSIRENLVRNLLWDGGSYCLIFARQIKDLGNGMADFNYGAAVAGLLLDEPAFLQPLLHGSRSIYQMLRNNLGRQAFYFEASPGYEFFTLDLYLKSAELIEALRQQKLTDAPSLYETAGALRYFTAPYRTREVGGHIPHLGNTRADDETVDPALAGVSTGSRTQSRFQQTELRSTWSVLARAKGKAADEALRWLRVIGGGNLPEPLPERWFVFHYDASANERTTTGPLPARTSTFEGGKGIALLRGGSGKQAHGLQFFFGPSQVKSQNEALSWTFFHKGAEWSYDPGRYNAHFRFGWSASTVAHQSVVVNRQDLSQAAGTGHLMAFTVRPDLQWVMGSHPGVYREHGVTRYERFIAQVQKQADGGLLYWLDVGRVTGGEVREDSFHTQMKKVAFSPAPEWKAAGKSLFGSENFNDLVKADYTLKGYSNGFYWTPPGSGYGFLAHPRTAPQEGFVRTTWSAPSFFADKSVQLLADFPADGSTRELVLADGGKAPGHPQVPYLLRTDRGPGSSVFAKVLHFGNEADPLIKGVHPVAVAPSGGLARAWIVERADGLRDLWILNDRAGNAATVKADGLPSVETDALVALVQLEADGKVLKAEAEQATLLRVEGGPVLQGVRELTGSIETLQTTEEGVVVTVRWNQQDAPGLWNAACAIVNVQPTVGQPSTWQVHQIEGDRVMLRDVSTVIAGGAATVKPDGWIEFQQTISRFSVGGSGNDGFALGKPVFQKGKQVGRITAVREDACAIRLDTPLPEGDAGDLEIREICEGDLFTIPLHLSWTPPAQ